MPYGAPSICPLLSAWKIETSSVRAEPDFSVRIDAHLARILEIDAGPPLSILT